MAIIKGDEELRCRVACCDFFISEGNTSHTDFITTSCNVVEANPEPWHTQSVSSALLKIEGELGLECEEPENVKETTVTSVVKAEPSADGTTARPAPAPASAVDKRWYSFSTVLALPLVEHIASATELNMFRIQLESCLFSRSECKHEDVHKRLLIDVSNTKTLKLKNSTENDTLYFTGCISYGKRPKGTAFKVAEMFDTDWWVGGTSHNNIMHDCPVAAWLVPSVKDSQGTMELHTETFGLVLDLGSWRLSENSNPPKRAYSDPDRCPTELEVTVKVPYLKVMKKLVGRPDVVLSVGTTQLGSKRAAADGKDFVANIKKIIQEMEDGKADAPTAPPSSSNTENKKTGKSFQHLLK